MKTFRAIIQDLNHPEMPTVTEMIVTGSEYIGGDILQFNHPDLTVTIINVKPGWNITVEPHEDETD